MLKYVTEKSAEFLCICLASDKGHKDCKKAYLHGEHLFVICRPQAMWTGDGERKPNEKRRSGRGEEIRLERVKERTAREVETKMRR